MKMKRTIPQIWKIIVLQCCLIEFVSGFVATSILPSIHPVLTTRFRHSSEGEIRPHNLKGEIKAENEIQDDIDLIPSVRRILSFALPATGIYLCSPLLSLIDTSTVGLLSGSNQQAALNPAASFTEYSNRLICFLYTGTTSLLASIKKNDEESKAGMLGSLQLSLIVGSILGITMFTFSKPLLRTLIGNDQIGSEVFDAALRYVRIRALGMPAAALLGTTQAACLGLQDVRSPLRIMGTAAFINLLADILLVRSPNQWIGGAAGASWATTLAQYAAAGMFFQRLWKQPISGSSSKGNATMKKSKESRITTTKGFLSQTKFPRDLLRLPSKSTCRQFMPYVLPVTMTQIGRCAVYVAMGYTVSSSLGTKSMAAQQIISSVFYTLIPITDSLSLTVQSIFPSIFLRNAIPTSKSVMVMRKAILNLAWAAGLFGLLLSSMMATLPLGLRFFTSDPAVASLVNSIVPILVAVFTLHGVFCASEGILVARKDLTFLGRMYGMFFLVVPYLMLRVKHASSMGVHVELRSVWEIFFGYQAFRISAWVLRVLWLQKKAETIADKK
jgi:Na+-driven multidrug efflux pump